MKRVSYGGESFVTSDEFADALVAFTAEVARGASSEALAVPAVDEQGNQYEVMLVIGPATEIITVPEVAMPEVAFGSAAADLRRHSAEMLASREAPMAYPLDGPLPVASDLD